MNRKEFRKQLDARFDAFEEKFNVIFDKFNAKLDVFEEKFNAIFDKFNAKLDDIDKMIKEQKKTYEQINDSLSIIQRDCQNNEDSY